MRRKTAIPPSDVPSTMPVVASATGAGVVPMGPWCQVGPVRTVGAMPDLLVDRHGATAVLTLNRPDRLNAISGPMLRDLSRALLEADRDAGVRCIVLTGAGRGFCAGLDLVDQSSGQGLGSGND